MVFLLTYCSAAPFSRFLFPHLFFPFSFYPIPSFAISFPLSSIFLIIVYSFHLHRALSLSPNEELQPGPNHRYPGPGLRYLGLEVQRPSPSRRTSQTRYEVGTRRMSEATTWKALSQWAIKEPRFSLSLSAQTFPLNTVTAKTKTILTKTRFTVLVPRNNLNCCLLLLTLILPFSSPLAAAVDIFCWMFVC